MDSQAIERVLALQLGADVRPGQGALGSVQGKPELWYEVRVGGDVHTFVIQTKTAPGRALGRLRRHQDLLASAGPDVIPLLAVPRLSRHQREQLRAHAVNHMDLQGNVWIRWPGFYVNIEGKLPRSRPRSRSGSNPFSKRASLVARILLDEPHRQWGVRELSRKAHLSLGYTSEVLRTLVGYGYATVAASGHGLGDAVALFEHWCGVYSWEDNEIYSFVTSLDKEESSHTAWKSLKKVGAEPVLTMLSAMDRVLPHVRHDQVHVYVPEFSELLARTVRDRLYAEPVPRGGNLHLLVPYYGSATWYGSIPVMGVQVASDVQLFLDLVHYPVRGSEAADALLRKVLAPRLRLSGDHRKSLQQALGL